MKPFSTFKWIRLTERGHLPLMVISCISFQVPTVGNVIDLVWVSFDPHPTAHRDHKIPIAWFFMDNWLGFILEH